MMIKFVFLFTSICICAADYGKGYHSIELPVKSNHNLEIIKSHSSREEPSTYADIPSGVLPVYLSFKTQSSPVYVKQEHRGTKGSYQKSDSYDEPHKLVHEVVKPVYQELREVIKPYRKVVQIIEGVREEVLTKVHKNEHSYDGSGGNGGKGYEQKRYKVKDLEEKNDDYEEKKSYKKDDYREKKYGESRVYKKVYRD